MMYETEYDMKGFVENIISKGRLHNIYFISEVSVEDRTLASGYGIFDEFINYQTGIHFGGNVMDNPVLDYSYISFSEQSKAEKPGIGQLPKAMDGYSAERVVVPLARR